MIKSRMFVVNSETLKKTIDTGIASIAVPAELMDKKLWLKTIADVMADMLQIEIGDYIFLWETRSGERKNRIHGVYRAISKPFYKCDNSNDLYPFKIYIEPAYIFENPIDEYELINCPYIKGSLWTILGKKVADKPRGTSPLSIEESKYIINLLIGVNSNFRFIPFKKKNIKDVAEPLTITYSNSIPVPSSATIQSINPNKLPFFDCDFNIRYEKMLETIFNYEMANKNSQFFSQLGIDVGKVIWFSNYLPYSLERSEMDYVIIESIDGQNISKIYMIEFLIQPLDESHIKRCAMYSKWVNEALALGTNFVTPIIICKKSPDFINGEKTESRKNKLDKYNNLISSYSKIYLSKEPEIYTYSFDNKGGTFTKTR